MAMNCTTADQYKKIRLYCVRIHDGKVDFELKVDFGDKTIISFNAGQEIYSKDHLIPFIYTLSFDIKIDDKKQLYVNYQNSDKLIDTYHLIISRPHPFIAHKKLHYPEKVNQEHKLSENFDNPDYFLFDIQFSKGILMEPPGENLE